MPPQSKPNMRQIASECVIWLYYEVLVMRPQCPPLQETLQYLETWLHLGPAAVISNFLSAVFWTAAASAMVISRTQHQLHRTINRKAINTTRCNLKEIWQKSSWSKVVEEHCVDSG